MSPTLPSPRSWPSYSCCARRMVRRALKPSLRAASCCSVEVVKGGAGLRRRCLRSIASTRNSPPPAAHLLPQQRGEIEADQIVESATRLLGVDELERQSARLLDRRADGVARDFV